MENPRCYDAVIVIPGIMGSELVDRASGSTLWGMRDLRWYLRAWTSGASLRALRLTESEATGEYDRVQATRLLRFPAFAPFFRGFEPYTRLVREIRSVVIHPDAVTEFPYDWRLPVTHNARLLAEVVDRVRVRWSRHPARIAAVRAARDAEDAAKVVLIAHSMGGLIVRHLGAIAGALDEVRHVITIGTPYYGSVKAAIAINSGRGRPVPLPRRRFRDLAVTLPGLYDLLPRYRCVDLGGLAKQLLPGDVALLGGDRQLSEEAQERYARVSSISLENVVQLVGAHQPTAQSITVSDGVATPQNYTCQLVEDGSVSVLKRVDLRGDGTVSRESAQLLPAPAMPLAHTHGAIASSLESCLVVTDRLTNRDTGPWQGAGELGIDVPDLVAPAVRFRIGVDGAEHPRDVNCRVEDVASGRTVAVPPVVFEDSRLVAVASVASPGIYRVLVAGGGSSATSQIFAATESCDDKVPAE